MEAYRITQDFPEYERYNVTNQIRRAALSVRLNVAEGSSRISLIERKRFYEIARSSLIEIDAALDVAEGLGYTTKTKLKTFGELIISTFRMLSGLIERPGVKRNP